MSASEAASGKVLIISSDGHATADMPDYRPYLPASAHADFDEFCKLYAVQGSHSFEPQALRLRLDSDVAEQWERDVVDTGRTTGNFDPVERLKLMEADGVSAEVIFPDFGLPFELYSPQLSRAKGFTRTPEQVHMGNQAYNRWLADYCSSAPERFRGMTAVSFDDVDAAVKEIRWAKQAGLAGVVLPKFAENSPLFDPRYEPIWNVLEELEMPVQSHVAISSATDYTVPIPESWHPAVRLPIDTAYMYFYCHQIFAHMIWGGVFERHPNLRLVLTEQGSGWVLVYLAAMDHSWANSYLRRDIREVVPRKPSEYFERQCYFGSSIFSRAEVEARHQIGLNKMMLGMDYPHHEGTLGTGTLEYLRATVGAARVPADEARRILGLNAADLWKFDVAKLQPVADRVGPTIEEIMRDPTPGLFDRGDVARPLLIAP